MMRELSFLVVMSNLVFTVGVHGEDEKPARILIGIEYVFLGGGDAFGKLGIPMAKPYGEMHEWGAMQKSKDDAIDFSKLDRLVKEYQDGGFTEIYLSLKSNSTWASRSWSKNPFEQEGRNTVPKQEYWPHYEAWVKGIVERYGGGKNSMKGLKHPVRYIEIGTEFSSYQPEPLADYLAMLEHGYKAAKAVNKDVVVLHAAFLPAFAFKDHPQPKDYAAGFANQPKRMRKKTLADIRGVLDKGEFFDAVNFHALCAPEEIEDTMAWLDYEMRQRKYHKPIVISDTAPNPLIGWGDALHSKAPAELLGLVIPPATEKDRPRLNAYFKKLVDKEKDALEWNAAFVGADMVKKVVIAAEQGAAVINTAFAEDLIFQQKLMAAGAGTCGWAGMAEVKLKLDNSRVVTGLRSNFYSLQQLQKHLKDYSDLKRIDTKEKRFRLYQWKQGKKLLWAAWLEPGTVYLSDEAMPEALLTIATGAGKFRVESMIDKQGQTEPEVKVIDSQDGKLDLKLKPWPKYVIGE